MKVFKHHFTEKESDITIISDSKVAIDHAKEAFYRDRTILENYVGKHPLFESSFEPVKIYGSDPIIQIMSQASEMYQVGPMAAVAGAFADLMLQEMKSKKPDFIPAKTALVENGGEIAIDSETDMKIALYAGENRLNLNIGFLITKKDCPLGIATSSAPIGHAVNLGRADAATIFCDNATNADAAATKIANLVQGDDIEQSIKKALEAVDDFPDIRGALICRENKVGHVGNIPQLFKIEGEKGSILKNKFETAFSDGYETIK